MLRKTDSVCPACEREYLDLYVDTYPVCECGAQTIWLPRAGDGGVVDDGIPGGLVVTHLSHTPMKFYSKTEIRRAANKLGWTQSGDTPKPYKVKWSGRLADGTPSETS